MVSAQFSCGELIGDVGREEGQIQITKLLVCEITMRELCFVCNRGCGHRTYFQSETQQSLVEMHSLFKYPILLFTTER